MIPSNTLLFRAEGLRVGVVRDGRVQLVPVKISKDAGATVEIASGLTPNDAVILDPSDSLASGQEVQIANRANQLADAEEGGGAMTLRPAAFASLAALLLSGCMVGPKYVKPTVPMAPEYKEATPDTYKENANWQVAQPADAAQRGEWWTIFGDAELNTLEPQVAADNQDLKAADARFREARALIRFNHASLYPTSDSRPLPADCASPPTVPTSMHQLRKATASATSMLPVDLNYEIDVWGRVRRTVSAAREEAQASAGDRQTVLLSLQAELAVDYFEARSADAQEKLLNDTVKYYEEAYRITNNRFEGGVAPKSDVDQAQDAA